MRAEQLETLPADEVECEEAADEADTAAARIAVGDRGVIERYHALNKAIDAQRAQQAEKAAALEKLQARPLSSHCPPFLTACHCRRALYRRAALFICPLLSWCSV